MVHEMPTYEVIIDGKPKRIEISKIGEKSFNVKLEEKSIKVELLNGKFQPGKEVQIKVGDKAYTVALPEISETKPFTVKVEEASFKTEIKTAVRSQTVALTVAERAVPSPAFKAVKPKQVVSGTVTAPMTGKIISIKVEKGEQVKAGQVLCILEAMKMENEITAPVAGIVREILVSEGSSVNEGDPLFVIG